MAYSKPLSFSFHKQEDFASVFTFNNTTLPLSTMRDSPFPELSSSPKSRFPTIPSPTNTSPFPSPFPKANGTTLAKYTDHSSHALPGECITECKICKTLYGLDIAAFYWSLMAMYGLPYRSPVSPPLPSDVRAKSPMGSACSDSQPPSPASSTGEEIGKESAIYRCNVCQKTYSHPRFLNRHLQSHTPFKKHHCPRCGKGFNDAFDLKRHIRTHTDVSKWWWVDLKFSQSDAARFDVFWELSHLNATFATNHSHNAVHSKPIQHVCMALPTNSLSEREDPRSMSVKNVELLFTTTHLSTYALAQEHRVHEAFPVTVSEDSAQEVAASILDNAVQNNIGQCTTEKTECSNSDGLLGQEVYRSSPIKIESDFEDELISEDNEDYENSDNESSGLATDKVESLLGEQAEDKEPPAVKLPGPSDLSQNLEEGPAQPIKSVFPAHLIGKNLRRFSSSFYSRHPWLEYSEISDAVFCYECRHFGVKASQETAFIEEGFRQWEKMLRN
eukprot:gene16317-7705_t